MANHLLTLLIIICISILAQIISTEEHLTRCRRQTGSSCILTPELTEGPYYWNTSLMRQNISEDRAGIRFRLQVLVTDVSTCSPIPDAAVTLWHCDALGLYSHYIQASQNQPNPQTDNRTFLRGIQLTNASGVATFDTIYPGWYNGRTTHIHVKVYLGGSYMNESSYYSGATYVHTGQLFFNDSLTDLVNLQSPYSSRTGNRVQNSEDYIYGDSGEYTLMNVQYVNSGNGVSGGLITSVTLSVTSTQTGNNGSTTTTSTTSTTLTTTATTTTTTTTATTTTATATTTTTTTTTSQIPNNGGGRVGGRPFWLW